MHGAYEDEEKEERKRRFCGYISYEYQGFILLLCGSRVRERVLHVIETRLFFELKMREWRREGIKASIDREE